MRKRDVAHTLAQANNKGSIPQSVIDAGDEPFATLERLVRTRLAEITPGQTLEIVASNEADFRHVQSWCSARNDLVVQADNTNGRIRLTITGQPKAAE